MLERIRTAGHTLAGSVGNLGGRELVRLARVLEALGKSADLSTAPGRLAELEAETERFLQELTDLLATEAGAALTTESSDMLITDRDQPYRALVVDDDAVLRTALQQFIARLGFEVQCARQWPDRVDLFQTQGSDIVLLDAAMPVMNGFSACEAIRALPEGRHVPIIIITIYEDEDSVDRAFASGATEYVTKPIHWAVLRNRVRQLVEAADAERRLRQDYAFFQSLVDAIPDPTLVCDRGGVVRWINENAGRFPLVAAVSGRALAARPRGTRARHRGVGPAGRGRAHPHPGRHLRHPAGPAAAPRGPRRRGTLCGGPCTGRCAAWTAPISA